jgi:hypothetical protein
MYAWRAAWRAAARRVADDSREAESREAESIVE